jgi:hypothetical protein
VQDHTHLENKIEGRKKAEKGVTYVIISNHQSILDILLHQLSALQVQMDFQDREYETSGTWMVPQDGRLLPLTGAIRRARKRCLKVVKCLQRALSMMLFRGYKVG